jgi:hypothetical protein
MSESLFTMDWQHVAKQRQESPAVLGSTAVDIVNSREAGVICALKSEVSLAIDRRHVRS